MAEEEKNVLREGEIKLLQEMEELRKERGGSFHISGDYECKCGAIIHFGEDFLLPNPPFEVKCDACGAVLIELGEKDRTTEREKE
ncbi:MAG TPA: hypothetical protein PL110_07170 [Candidatus Eremiobacteraeota bacterium]|nr:MAG: hypothetical protein BWY64_02661 [bacterium ADurb.Bin363]HPZ07875.1 hypothetical protein [Candidatus Eremiobacteraeota bacterium]